MKKSDVKRKRSNSLQQKLRAVKDYCKKKFSVIPLEPRGKKPAISAWKDYQNERMPEKKLLRYFEADPDRNVGIVTGKASGIVVVDLDSKEAREFAKKNGFPDTPTVKTARGYHYYYAHPGNRTVRNATNLLGVRGLDLRGDGGIVVAPPSIHETGVKYKWVKGKSLDDLPLAPLPQILLAKGKIDKTPLKDLLKGVKKGRRNAALIRLAGSWVKKYPLKVCLKKALEWNKTCKPPEDEDKVIASVKSIWKKEQAKRKPLYTPEEKKQALKLLKSKNLIEFFLATCRRTYVGRENELLLVKLATITRHLNVGVPVFITGASSEGKSLLFETVLGTVWKPDVMDFTSVTPKYFDYLEEPLNHKIILFLEAAGFRDTQEVLKTAMSEGRINVGKVVADDLGRYETQEIKKSAKGLVVFSTTTLESFFIGHELDTRIIKIELEHKDALTEKAMLHTGQQYQGVQRRSKDRDPSETLDSQALSVFGSLAHKKVKRVWQVADKLIKRKKVIVPFSERLAALFPSTEARYIRDLKKVLHLIQASALLHQHQRERDNRKRIIASPEDYKIVYSLGHLIAQSTAEVPNHINNFLKVVQELMTDHKHPTAKLVQEKLGVSDATMKRYVSLASKKELIETRGVGQGKTIKLLVVPGEKASILPKPKILFKKDA